MARAIQSPLKAPHIAVPGALLSVFLTVPVSAGVITEPPEAELVPVPVAVASPAIGAEAGDRPSAVSEAAGDPLHELLTASSLEEVPAAPDDAADGETELGTLSVPAVLPLLGVGLIALRLFTERRLRRRQLRQAGRQGRIPLVRR
jgi:hypothetical protein